MNKEVSLALGGIIIIFTTIYANNVFKTLIDNDARVSEYWGIFLIGLIFLILGFYFIGKALIKK